MTVRPAVRTDLDSIARLHAQQITEGFLTSLGTPFLRRLYARVLRSDDAFLLVDDIDGEVSGFVASVTHLATLYRRFIIRDGVLAAGRAAPHVLRSLPRVLETLRYPATTIDLPDAEILSVAVATHHGGRGIGQTLVRAAIDEFRHRKITAAKVVTTADNSRALAMYRACGFVSASDVEVHSGRSSEVLVWTAS